MDRVTNLYCSLWGLHGCQIFSTLDAIRLIIGSFALACLLIWAFGFIRRRG